MSKIIIKPIVTEKMTNEAESRGKYAFEVVKSANKIQIKEAIEKMYEGVTVESVNTINFGGGKAKAKYTNKGVSFQKPEMGKKALITLTKGQVIDFYSNI
jgi:large subunit ribosomal protein L23